MLENTFPCPRCHAENIKGSVDCEACGIVFAKYSTKQSNIQQVQQRQEDLNSLKDQGSKPNEFPPPIQKPGSVNPELEELWQKVMEEYDDEEVHENFINKSIQLNGLTYASAQYHTVLDSHPHEEIAEKMQKRITFLAMTIMTPEHAIEPEGFRFGISGLIVMLGAMLMGSSYLLSDLLIRTSLNPRLFEVSGAAMIIIGVTLILLRKKSKS